MLSNVIVKHIFKYFGIGNPVSIFSIQTDKFLINKEFSIELEDGEVLQKNIWGLTGKIGTSVIQAILADITVDQDQKEYVLIFQLDNLSVYALKLYDFEDKPNTAYFSHNEATWVELSTLLLAKLLVGIEQLNELFIDYQPIANYQELYQHLISFMNYEETIQNP